MRKQIKRTKRTEKKNEWDKQNTTAEIQKNGSKLIF